MAAHCLLDNDVVIKVAAYGLGEPVVQRLTISENIPAILGVARYVVLKKTMSAKRFSNPEAVSAAAAELLECLELVEPSDGEIEFAAELEDSARACGGSLDVGEAQLLAILLKRAGPALVTGDKRAIHAAAKIDLKDAAGRLVCLEQLIACVVDSQSCEHLRKRVCTEPKADRAISNCFSCSSFEESELADQDLMEALQSYFNDLRKTSGGLLMGCEDLSALTA